MTDLTKVFKVKLRETRDGRFRVVCSCGGYRSARPMTRDLARFYGDRHIDAHIKKLINPLSAVLVGVGVRYVGESNRMVQLLATSIIDDWTTQKSKPAFKIDMSPADARRLAAELNRYADEAEDR